MSEERKSGEAVFVFKNGAFQLTLWDNGEGKFVFELKKFYTNVDGKTYDFGKFQKLYLFPHQLESLQELLKKTPKWKKLKSQLEKDQKD